MFRPKLLQPTVVGRGLARPAQPSTRRLSCASQPAADSLTHANPHCNVFTGSSGEFVEALMFFECPGPELENMLKFIGEKTS